MKREAVVSVRISTAEQAQLRRRADERGLSVSELLRGAALGLLGETADWPMPAEATTKVAGELAVIWSSVPAGCYPDGSGLIWNAPPRAKVEGATLTL